MGRSLEDVELRPGYDRPLRAGETPSFAGHAGRGWMRQPFDTTAEAFVLGDPPLLSGKVPTRAQIEQIDAYFQQRYSEARAQIEQSDAYFQQRYSEVPVDATILASAMADLEAAAKAAAEKALRDAPIPTFGHPLDERCFLDPKYLFGISLELATKERALVAECFAKNPTGKYAVATVASTGTELRVDVTAFVERPDAGPTDHVYERRPLFVGEVEDFRIRRIDDD